MRVLLIKLKHLGDTLLLTPTIRFLKERFPGIEIDVIVRSSCEAILESNPDVSRVLAVARPESERRTWRSGLRENLRLIRTIIGTSYDFAFDLSDSDRAKIWVLLSRAKVRGFRRIVVKAVENGPHGPEIILSRADPQFVIKLFKLEVSEISDGTIEIKGIAREPGFRTKLAVYTRDEKVDPVGACVGLRGQRVKNIVRELNNEKVDIIKWDPNPQTFIANALSPAKLKGFEMDETRHRVKILVAEDQLSLAIGKRGQNARLTSKLTGWQIDIEPEAVVTFGFEEKVAQAVQTIAAIPGITKEQADSLVHAGFLNLDDLLQAEASDLEQIEALKESAAAIVEAAKAEAARRAESGGDSAQRSVA